MFVCKCVLPPGDKPIAVNKYINISYPIWSALELKRSSAVTKLDQVKLRYGARVDGQQQCTSLHDVVTQNTVKATNIINVGKVI